MNPNPKDDMNAPIAWPDAEVMPIPSNLRRDMTHEEMKMRARASEAYRAAQTAETQRMIATVRLSDALDKDAEKRRRERVELSWGLLFTAAILFGGIGIGLGLSTFLR